MRKQKPTGPEIAEKAKGIRLLKSKTAHGTKDGKSIRYVPANLGHVSALEELEEGQVIGVLENDLEGDETGLPVGEHNMFLTKVDGEWHVYAESGGNVVAEALRVDVNHYKLEERKPTTPAFNPNGWCWCVCLLSCWGHCICKVCFCC